MQGKVTSLFLRGGSALTGGLLSELPTVVHHLAVTSLPPRFSNQGRKIILRWGPSRVLGDSILSPLRRKWTVARRVVEPGSPFSMQVAKPGHIMRARPPVADLPWGGYSQNASNHPEGCPRLHNILCKGASDHTRDSSPGAARQTLTVRGRYPPAHWGLFAD
jgi:hypothetical protein